MKTSPHQALEQVFDLCYDEDCERLTEELKFIQRDVKSNQKDLYYLNLIKEVMEMIYICAEDFDIDTYIEIENIFTEISES